MHATIDDPNAEVRDPAPIVPDDMMDPPLEEMDAAPVADESADAAEPAEPADVTEEPSGALDLSEFRMDDIPEPASIEVDEGGMQSPEGEALVKELAQAANGDLDDLFLDLEEEEVVDEPVIDEELLEDYAKTEDVSEVRDAIDLLYERIETLDAALEERDETIAALQSRITESAAQAKRAETLALGQNEVLAEFIRVKDKVDMAEELIVDLSQRLARMETNDPADRVEVDRSIKAINERIETMARDIGLIARVAINGSTTGGVATAPATKSVPGSETVYSKSPEALPRPGDKAEVPSDVQVGDFVEGYGYVLQIMPTSDGSRVVVMENSSVMID
jgi:hypothetical protein